MTDQEYMLRAIQLAKKGEGWTNPNPMVGAVIVKDGRIIGEGYHKKCGELHAERNAIASLTESAEGATIYVTLEPCCHYGKTPPCADKIIEKKIGRVVVGALDPNPLVAGRGIEKIRNAGIEVKTGVLAEESIKLNEIFMKYIVNKEPFVLYKSAMSLDGKIATSTGESQWISCEASRREVHELRHQYMAIMVGSQTVLDDDPMLNCRLIEGKDPIRVVVDSALRIPMTARLVKTARDIRTIVACTPRADEKKIRDLQNAGAAAVMPLAAPIGSNKGLATKAMIQVLIDEIDLPIIVDAGIGRPSQACEAMEMGAAAVMANTAIATAGDVPAMAEAFKKAIEAGRSAYLSGLGRTIERGASASSPLTGFLQD